MNVLALDEEQRQAVDEAYDVCAAAVQIAAHPQLPDTNKIVVIGVVEVDDAATEAFLNGEMTAEDALAAIQGEWETLFNS